ncbi:MAG: hypothetical protein JXD19_08855 [Deltaproteobacteria bacterium]|nr:hypothetical protein [Deltaproteobacteria bacterium]
MNKEGSIHTAVTKMSKFLREGNWKKCAPDILELIGRSSSVDRVYLFENHRAQSGQILCSQKFEWVANGVPSQIDNPELQNFSWHDNGFEDWLQLLKEGTPVAGPTSRMAESKKYVLYDMQGILSIVLVPVFVEKSLWGFIGFDDCSKPRRWKIPEIDALRVTVSVMGALIEKERMLQKKLVEIKKPQDLLPICSYCKKIRDEQGRWWQLEQYFSNRWKIDFSHGVCPDCLRQYQADFLPRQHEKKGDS